MANDYSKLSKEELLKVVEKLESRKKYGLIWDEEKTKEQFEKESENALPVLKEVKGKEIKTDPSKPVNILIEGDNYHALSVLNYTHQRKIDVIYIDPPYNTGNKDFKYNDKFIDEDDSYRHSKWLSFMKKRLNLAKNLLTNTGVIFISIDDNEQAQLKLLCDEIFGEKNFIETIIWKKRATPPNDRPIGRIHEYIHVYSRASTYYLGLLPRDEKSVKRYSNPDNDPKGDWVASDLSASGKGGRLVKGCIYPILNKGKSYMPPEGKCWLFNKEKMDLFIREGRIGFRKNSGAPFLKRYLSEVRRGVTMPSILSEHGFSFHSAKEIDELFGEKGIFEHPKPLKLMETVLQLATKKNSIVLDFFAGSGTTGHAVLNLNMLNSGLRSFILCTNNESNICYDVTFQRFINITKKQHCNLKVFRTNFIKNSISKDSLKVRITQECTEMLCLREGIFDEVKEADDYRIFQHNDHIMGVYYSLERGELKSLKKDLDKIKGKKILYCFTLDPLGLDKKDFRDWKGVSLEPIPQKILDIYEGIYEY